MHLVTVGSSTFSSAIEGFNPINKTVGFVES